MNTHDLKTWAPHWRDIHEGRKHADIRIDDRGYRVGDMLVLREWAPYEVVPGDGVYWTYTGRVCEREVTHIFKGGQFGLPDGYVMLSLRDKGTTS